MTDYYTADLHLHHEKVAQLRGYTDYKAHDHAVLQGIVDTLKPGDRLHVLGDVTGMVKNWAIGLLQLAILTRRCNTELHLYPGNHDPYGPHSRRAARYLPLAQNWCASVQHLATTRIAGQRALLCHYPYEGDHTATERMIAYRPRDTGMPIIHGHTHATSPLSYTTMGTPQLCVSLDAWGMRPVSKDKLGHLLAP